MNSEQKQALEFSVPLRETCEKMQWQEETFFFWCFDYSNSNWKVGMKNRCKV